MSDRRRELEDLYRQQVEADLDILRGLQRRAQLARRLGELGPPGSAPDEHKQLSHLVQLAGDELPAEMVRGVFREVHAATSSFERSARVVYVGLEGDFCHLAALQQFGVGAAMTSVEGPEQALDEVRRRRADFAVFPFESSLEGPLQVAVEALSATELSLGTKLELGVQLSLLGHEGNASTSAPTQVFVAAGDRKAVDKFIAAFAPGEVNLSASPLAACRACLDKPGSVAIAPAATGISAGLSVLKPDVSDRHDVRMRYGVASARPASRSGTDTTALIFGVHDRPGALFDVLKHFAERNISVKTIQSRPLHDLHDQAWSYVIYLEVDGHVTDRALVTALEEVKRQTRILKVLGSFPSC